MPQPPRVNLPPRQPQVVAPQPPPPVVVPKKGREHFQAFIKDLEGSTKKFTRSRSSVEKLLDYMEKQIASPTQFAGQNEAAKLQDALGKCGNSKDTRLLKYHEAIKRMVKVWGTNNAYPAAPVVSVATSGTRAGDIKIARQVCDALTHIMIADVDFSENVRKAAKAKRIGSSNLYDIVKRDYTTQVQNELERVMTTQKANAVVLKEAGIPLIGLGKIADSVTKAGFAVCESITATIISECKKNGFGGRLEWIGIVYDARTKTGHSIVVAHRRGNDLTDVTTWGDYFIIDMWYYNLGMRDIYLWDGADRATYYTGEIARGKYPVRQLADV